MTAYSLGLTDRDRVNSAFGGGLPTSSIVLLEGPDGAGKSVLTQRAVYGMVESGHSVAHVSTELTVAAFVEQMASLSYDVVSHLLDERLLFLHAPVDTYGPDRQRDLLEPFQSATVLWRADVIVVDGFGALLRNDPEFAERMAADEADRAMERFVRFLRQVTATGRTVVLTVDPVDVDGGGLSPLRRSADVYLTLETETVGQEIRRQAVVNRFAGMGSQVDDTIGFAVQQGRGLTIETRTVA